MLGSGNPEAERFFSSRARERPEQFCAWFPFDDPCAHRIQAGADFFLMPSRFEPCGLSQLHAMRYGTLPVVRATGGLVDTVINYDEATGAGTGFVFHDLRPDSLADTIGWTISTWHNRPLDLDVMRRRAMAEDHSWDQAAREYWRLYLAAYARRRGHQFSDVAAAEPSRPPRRFTRCPARIRNRSTRDPAGAKERLHAPDAVRPPAAAACAPWSRDRSSDALLRRHRWRGHASAGRSTGRCSALPAAHVSLIKDLDFWVQLATRIPKALQRKLRLYCVTAEISVMDFVTKAIEEKLAAPSGTNPTKEINPMGDLPAEDAR